MKKQEPVDVPSDNASDIAAASAQEVAYGNVCRID
jgi:hypothetical protein